ncbi:MAG: helix-turn-helix domain-containing protein [Eubacteriales bacterium]
MKLSIGDNIRKFRKKNDLTQEELADRLGVSYQSVSRWENGLTYPDIEFLPAIAEMLSCSVDQLMGIPDAEKEKKAVEAFDELRRECMKPDYDADRIVSVIRDIRRNHIGSENAWRPWVEGNDRAFRDPKILPEVRLMAEAYLEKHPMHPHTIQTMANIEDEDHLWAFLKKYTTSFDCSKRRLLFNRYWRLRNKEKFEPERRYMLYSGIETLLYPPALIGFDGDSEKKKTSDEFMEAILTLIRDRADGNKPDMWIMDRLELGFKRAGRLACAGKTEDALSVLSDCVELLEETMKITDKVLFPTSCSWLEGMEWEAEEDWTSPSNDPDSSEERFISISTKMGDMSNGYCVFPNSFANKFSGKCFDSLRDNPKFTELAERVKKWIVTRPKQGE